jgi:hypothetical protein
MTIVVVASLLVLLGVAVDYSTQISRTTQRSRKTAQAMEIADGHLENLFTNWRNIYRTTWTTVYGANTGGTDYSLVGTNYFYTTCATCSPTPAGAAPTPVPSMTPSGTPPTIPLPASTNFPPGSNYTVTQYRIQAVDPMITLDASGNALVEGGSKGSGGYVAMSAASPPPAAYGPNYVASYGVPGFPYSLYYLASVDVTVPALTGDVTAKVRRVFEKKFDLPWTYAMFFVDDLEFQPTAAFSVTGPVHKNSSLYIGTNNFTTSSRVEYGTDYVNGYSPNDSSHNGTPTSPNFAKSVATLALSDCPPAQVSPYLPFGWNLTFNTADTGSGAGNNDGYREIIERPSSGTDQLSQMRMYNQAGIRVSIDDANNVTASYADGTTPSNSVLNTIKGALTTNKPIYDNRENGYVRLVDVDIYQLAKAANAGSIPNWNGIFYISDTTATTYNTDGTVKTAGKSVSVTLGGTTANTTKRGIRLKNATILPSSGLTLVSENPIYIQGDYNTNPNGSTGGSTAPAPAPTPASDVSPGASPAASNVVSGSNKYAAIMGDAITLLSNNWVDTNSTGSPTGAGRFGVNTTVNAALVAGTLPSAAGVYGGGGENFVRFLEDWTKNTNHFVYYGSMAQLFRSQQAIGAWSGAGSIYKAPVLHWYYDNNLTLGAPPGNMILAAYLQQQRWYQVY